MSNGGALRRDDIVPGIGTRAKIARAKKPKKPEPTAGVNMWLVLVVALVLLK